MKKLLSLLFLGTLSVSLACLTLTTGCMTSKIAQAGPNGTTNFVTVVNELNLSLDCEAIKLGAAGTVVAVKTATKSDPKVMLALADAHTTLDGILHGVNPSTSQDVLDMLTNSGNPTLAKEAQSFAKSVSDIEQKYLQGVSASVAGEITTKITQAIAEGLGLGLEAGI